MHTYTVVRYGNDGYYIHIHKHTCIHTQLLGMGMMGVSTAAILFVGATFRNMLLALAGEKETPPQ
jgi:hypothetical protein